MAQFGIKKYKALYGGVSLLAVLLVTAATGGGLFGAESFWLADWQHRVFRMVCHQDPSRSFWFNGIPMAVCSRCYGIYTGFAGFWLSIPVIGSLVQIHKGKKLLLATVLLNLIDIIGNLLGFWQNTLVSRFLLGSLTGMAAVLLLAGDFTHKSQLKRDTYGLDGT